MNESPFSNEWIEDMLNSGKATELWPAHDRGYASVDGTEGAYRDDTDKDWVYGLLGTLGLSEREHDFFNAIAAGHTTADASRLAGRQPRWGRKLLARVRAQLRDAGH